MMDASRCPLCENEALDLVHLYEEAPEGEVTLPRLEGRDYRRELYRCRSCGHMISSHEMSMEALYEGDYVDATYGAKGLRGTYDRINNLPENRSDNVGRVNCLNEWMMQENPEMMGRMSRTLLDVGAGLGVFPYRMKQAGWTCTALDPDPRAVRHARDVVGVAGLCGDFMRLEPESRYDLISFNKVLEHVELPVDMLNRSRQWLASGGYVYVELPDAGGATQDGFHREEFFIEHHHIFSAASLSLLAGKAGLEVRRLQCLREPSSKYTLRALLRSLDGAGDDVR